MNENTKRIRQIVDRGLGPALKNSGFHRHGSDSSRKYGEALHVVNFQLGKWNTKELGKFTLNIGAHFTTVAALLFGTDPMPLNPKEGHAELEAEVEDRDKKLAAAQAELEPLKKTMANVAAAAVPVSKIAPTDTVGRNRAILFVDPSGALLWFAKGADGKYFLAALNDLSDTTTLKDVLDKGFWKSVTIGDLTDESQAWGKKALDEYNALVDKYNAALALLKQSNELASQEQAFIQQMRANTAANQAAERQARINNALLMYSLMQHQTYTPPQIFYNVPTWQPKPTINCTSTALVSGMVNTTCQ